MFVRGLCILGVSLLLTSGCSDSGREHREILGTLSTRANALNSRNMSQYISTVSPQYNDKGKNFVRLKESVEKNFRDFEQISYEAGTQSITVKGNSAESAGSFRMKVKLRGKELTLNGAEHLMLVKEPEGWKIIAGI